MVEQFEKTLRTGKNVSKEHRDYILMKEIYHCTPTELYKQEERMLDMHYEFLMAERKHEYIESQREKQKANRNSHLKKK